jgi:hypothetical protein
MGRRWGELGSAGILPAFFSIDKPNPRSLQDAGATSFTARRAVVCVRQVFAAQFPD